MQVLGGMFGQRVACLSRTSRIPLFCDLSGIAELPPVPRLCQGPLCRNARARTQGPTRSRALFEPRAPKWAVCQANKARSVDAQLPRDGSHLRWRDARCGRGGVVMGRCGLVVMSGEFLCLHSTLARRSGMSRWAPEWSRGCRLQGQKARCSPELTRSGLGSGHEIQCFRL